MASVPSERRRRAILSVTPELACVVIHSRARNRPLEQILCLTGWRTSDFIRRVNQLNFPVAWRSSLCNPDPSHCSMTVCPLSSVRL